MRSNISVRNFKSNSVLTVVIMDIKQCTANASHDVENAVENITQEIGKLQPKCIGFIVVEGMRHGTLSVPQGLPKRMDWKRKRGYFF